MAGAISFPLISANQTGLSRLECGVGVTYGNAWALK